MAKPHNKYPGMENILFPVEKVDLMDLIPEGTIPGLSVVRNCNHAIVGTVKNKPKILQFCSKGYTVLSNEVMLDNILPLLSPLGAVETSVRSFDHRRFFITVAFKEAAFKVGAKEDLIFPAIAINNSYDGGLKFGLDLGYYRQICSNGMRVPYSPDLITKINMLHTAQLGESSFQTKINDTVIPFVENGKRHAKFFSSMTKIKIDPMVVLNKVAENTRFPKRQIEAAHARVLRECDELNTDANLWLAYNGLNYVLNHGEMAMQEHKRVSLDRTILGFLQREYESA
jgi:hypothetical protein